MKRKGTEFADAHNKPQERSDLTLRGVLDILKYRGRNHAGAQDRVLSYKSALDWEVIKCKDAKTFDGQR